VGAVISASGVRALRTAAIAAGALLVGGVAGAAGWEWLGRSLAADTLKHAMSADDADRDADARDLFWEACQEGSREACKMLREQAEMDQAAARRGSAPAHQPAD
jgi:hypothetical protein